MELPKSFARKVLNKKNMLDLKVKRYGVVLLQTLLSYYFDRQVLQNIDL